MSAEEVINADCKEYHETGKRFTVSQIEELSFSHFAEKQSALIDGLEQHCRRRGLLLAALLVTDVRYSEFTAAGLRRAGVSAANHLSRARPARVGSGRRGFAQEAAFAISIGMPRLTKRLCLTLACLLALTPLAALGQVQGAKADGVTDDTAAIQQALDETGKTGGRVSLPPGKYLVKGSLRIPPGVMLQGAVDSPVWIKPLNGTVILATGGRDNEEGPPVFDLGNSATVRGLTVYYPEQKLEDVHPYSWTFRLQGFNNTVENVTLVNSYNGVRIGPGVSGRHRIRSLCGCVLRRGIFVEFCVDIGRIENVQFHSHWWSEAEVGGGDMTKVGEYMWHHLEAFVFGRTDWEYVNNTFVFPVMTGYHFIHTRQGDCNGHSPASAPMNPRSVSRWTRFSPWAC